MNKFTFKYYPPKILILSIILVLVIIISIKWGIDILFSSKKIGYSSFFIYLLLSSGVTVSVFFLINKFGLNKITAYLLSIPDLRGKYEGKLVSSYYVDDDPNKPHMTKAVRMEINQNLNGFLIKSFFGNRKNSNENSSVSQSISGDITEIEDGRFLITYLYLNDPNKFHADDVKYRLDWHRGIAELIYDTKDETLKGYYWNNMKDRSSYGTLILQRIKK